MIKITYQIPKDETNKVRKFIFENKGRFNNVEETENGIEVTCDEKSHELIYGQLLNESSMERNVRLDWLGKTLEGNE